jgi:hypothetical protein
MNISSSGNSFNVVILHGRGGLDEEENITYHGYSFPPIWSGDSSCNQY